jgi:hypothetical protein
MGLGKYRPYKDEFHDEGYEKRVTVPADFVPDFYNRNTIQVWDVSSVASEVQMERSYFRRQKLA